MKKKRREGGESRPIPAQKTQEGEKPRRRSGPTTRYSFSFSFTQH
jgi:hypothetical protein